MTKIYIVKQNEHDGEYPFSYPIKAFFDKNRADELVEQLNAKLEAEREYIQYLWDTHVKDCEEDVDCPLCDKYFELQNKNVYICSYTIKELEVE